MTLETAAETLPSSIVRARAALRGALACPLQTWERDETRRWRRVWTPDDDGSDVARDADATADAELADLLEKTRAISCTCRAAADQGRDVIAAPLIEQSGNVRAVVVAILDSSSAPYAVRLADSALKEFQQREEIEWLRDENFVFSQQVTDDFEELTFLRTMATHLVVKDTSIDIGRLVEKTISGMRQMIGAEAIYFVKQGEDGGCEVVQSCSANPDGSLSVGYAAIARLAAANAERADSVPCVRNDLAVSDLEAHAAGVRQFLMVTIATAARGFGWFVAVNRCNVGRQWAPSPLLQIGQDEFGTWEASLLSAAATLVASHASNLDLIREKERLLISTVRSLVSAVDAKDAYTRGHSERVALFSKRISQELNYEPAAAERLYLSGLLHDVGKIGVSDATLRKPDKLTDEEYAEIKRHPDEGWSILRDLEQLRYVLPGVLHHHEQVNGTGYPDGLQGDQIPQDARIMAVADAYDAMTSDRAYRSGMPHEKAIAILREGAGDQWDAEVVEAFLRVIDDIIAIRYGYQLYERPARRHAALTPNCQS